MASNKNVKLMLTENVDNLGIVGDVVNVRSGYARNYLLPHGLADQPTAGNLKRVEARRAEVQKQLREKRQQQEALLAKLAEFELTVKRSANEEGVLYGSVSQHDIAIALQEAGFAITDRDIRIGDAIKHIDTYTIPVQIARDLKTEIKLTVERDQPSEALQAEMEAGEETAEATEKE